VAIYHFQKNRLRRSRGTSAINAAAYRAGERLFDERRGRHYNYLKKTGVIHSEILLPEGAPARLSDRATLWNEVEARERRKDAHLADEIEFAIPREMNPAHGVALARDFVSEQFVKLGMIADLNIHWDIAPDGSPKPHAHVLLSTRPVASEGFGLKATQWRHLSYLLTWRKAWADHVNERLAMLDIDARIDHRSLKAQGIDLQPQHKIGPAGARRATRGENAERAEDHRRIARENGVKIIADPGIALFAITRCQATFTSHDLAMFVHRHSDGQAQFEQVMAAVRSSPELVALGQGSNKQNRFTSREMLAIEQRLERAGMDLTRSAHHGVVGGLRNDAVMSASRASLVLSTEQRSALEHISGPEGLALVVGYAGTGKSAMLGVAREAWEGSGYTVRGIALSGIAARNLENGSGIASRTIASLEYQWGKGRELLTRRDVLVIDEAGMIGTRQMERVMSAARDTGAKIVLVGDPEQLQSIEAGAAFRSLTERHGAVEITEIRRQNADWQREATKNLATGRTFEAIRAYERSKRIRMAETRDQARIELIDRWNTERLASPGQSRIILTHTNAEVHVLNVAARGRIRDAAGLGDDIKLEVARGRRIFAAGDRVMFLKNDRGLRVKNGSLGEVERVDPKHMAVRLDDGRSIKFSLREYAHVDHGYAATVHKAQGVTVDCTHILATPGLDRHSAYVALSRHRDRLHLHYGREEFDDWHSLARALSRERAKDMASDYVRTFRDEVRAFAERRGLSGANVASKTLARTDDFDTMCTVQIGAPPNQDRVANVQRPGTTDDYLTNIDRDRPGPRRAMFDRLKHKPSSLPLHGSSDSGGRDDCALAFAIGQTSRSILTILDAQERGFLVLEHQRKALAHHIRALDRLRPDASRDLAAVFERSPKLIREAAAGRAGPAVAALAREALLQADPELCAKRSIEHWQALKREADVALGDPERAEGGGALTALAKAIGMDPPVEAILSGRSQKPGLPRDNRQDQTSRIHCIGTMDRGRIQRLRQ
jgi:Ti-type conjugative transfer relaxase TraA